MADAMVYPSFAGIANPAVDPELICTTPKSTVSAMIFSVNASKFLFCPTKGHSHDSEPIGII